MSDLPSTPLDAATVVALHRMMRGTPDFAEKGVAQTAVRLRRFDVLEVLHAAGELEDKGVANACVVQAVVLKDAESLRWLVQRDAKPAVVKPPKPVAGRIDNPPRSAVIRDSALRLLFAGRNSVDATSVTWVEGLRILLDANAIAPSDWVDEGHSVPTLLLELALKSSAPECALDLLDRGAVPVARLLGHAFLSGNLEVAARFATATREISLREVRDLRFEMENREYFKKLGKPTLTKFSSLLDALVGDGFQMPEKELATRRGMKEIVDLLARTKSSKAVRKVVQRYAHKADDFLFYGASIGSADIVRAALEFGGRLEPDEATLKERALVNEKAARNFSPYPVHNAGSGDVLKLMIDAGADLSVKWKGEGVLHHSIRMVGAMTDSGDGKPLRESVAIFETLHATGVDFGEGANGRSVMQIAASLKEPLRRVLASIRTGDRISAAMKDDGQPDGSQAPKPSAPGIL